MINRQYSVAALFGIVTYLCVAFALIQFGITNELLPVIFGGILMVGGFIGALFGFLLRGRKAFFKGAFLAVLLLGVVYPLSFGPASWIAMRIDWTKHATAFRRFSYFYQPISVAIIRSPHSVHDSAMWYLDLGAPANVEVLRGWHDGILWQKPGSTYTVLSLSPSKKK